MTTDLIHRLRVSAAEWLPTSDHTLRAHKLLDEAADALARVETQLRAAKTIVHCKDEQASHIRREYGALRAAAADVQGERDANAILTEQVERLEAEVGALRPDAERYRWLRTAAHDWGICQWDRVEFEWVRDSRGATVIDNAIDAAMAAQPPVQENGNA